MKWSNKYLVKYGYLPDKTPTTSTPLANGAINVTSNNSVVNTSVPTTAPAQPEKSVTSSNNYGRGEIPRALGDFQEFMSLKKTMMLDSETLQLMSLPRCGVEDKRPHVSWLPDIMRRRRFVVEGSKWSKTALTYSISQPSSKLAINDQKEVLKLAFSRWAEVSPLTFTYTDNSQGADINVRFASLSHGDGKPFDGPGNTLGHAFYPSAGGDVHFDEDEAWVTGLSTVPTTSKSLYKVAVHEIGHSLGLKHSSVTGSIMSPLYHAGSATTLADDDIRGAQAMYGQCSTSIDTVFSWIANGRTYFFKGANTWRFLDAAGKSEASYPKSVGTQWIGVPNNIDEGFLWAGNWKTYFFKGSNYYRYNDQLDRVESGYPKSISSGWSGVPDNIDAAFSLSSQVSYFFKGNLCYKFDSATDKVSTGYPKTISECFPGVPDNLDSAFRYYWDDVSYFFKGHYYYRWDATNNKAIGPYLIETKWKNLCFV
eukprot:gene12223-2854_t